MWINEPAVVHHSSFVEEDEGRSLNSFVPVPTYEGTAELKINEEGVPINLMEGISEFLEMEGRGVDAGSQTVEAEVRGKVAVIIRFPERVDVQLEGGDHICKIGELDSV